MLVRMNALADPLTTVPRRRPLGVHRHTQPCCQQSLFSVSLGLPSLFSGSSGSRFEGHQCLKALTLPPTVALSGGGGVAKPCQDLLGLEAVCCSLALSSQATLGRHLPCFPVYEMG